mgnify:FL=1
MEKLRIYTQENCKYCEQVKSVFKENNIDFIEMSTKKYPKEWKKIMYMSTMGITPTILYKDFYFIANRDFQTPEQLVEILKDFEKPDVDNSILVLERTKTLNYNIMLALQNLNEVINKINNKLGGQDAPRF